VRRAALRYFHPIDKDKNVVAVILKFANGFVVAHGSTPLIHHILGSGGPDTRRRTGAILCLSTAKKRGTMAKKVKIDTNKEIKINRKQIVDLVDNLHRWADQTEGLNKDLAHDLWLANNVLGYLVVSGTIHKKGVVIPPTKKKKKKKKAKQTKQDRSL
jgi:hypothetical protein